MIIKGKRPRIPLIQEGYKIEHDEADFGTNLCSKNARKVFSIEKRLTYDVWFDKHYYIRAQFGDGNGKREGIEIAPVSKLIITAFEHLLFYVIKRRDFSFANHDVIVRPERIVLTKKTDQEIDLNIIAEYHFIKLNKYEVTVITAMRNDAFKINEGQYQLEIGSDESSKLFRKERGIKKKISEIYY